ncbi:hypothetical protein GJV26_14990 [Massilia dura]|uniref:RadC-like JAB domain-containing protein n=1 Tax=Pseudoduganella dura TaxID=321982 RepID=A0A6I3XMD4_9BURK|nr:hypothetical protein [Pseudoduganella dura]
MIQKSVRRDSTRLKLGDLVHYHALGLPEPSKADVRLTRTLVQALNFVDIRVADHIIVAETRHTRSPNTVRYKF